MAHQKATGNKGRQRIAALALAVVLALGASLAIATPVNAAAARCEWPRCTVWLSKQETNNYAYWGTMPQPPMAGPLAAVWYVAGSALRWFAIQYANRGMCIGFNISAAPWESKACSVTGASCGPGRGHTLLGHTKT